MHTSTQNPERREKGKRDCRVTIPWGKVKGQYFLSPPLPDHRHTRVLSTCTFWQNGKKKENPCSLPGLVPAHLSPHLIFSLNYYCPHILVLFLFYHSKVVPTSVPLRFPMPGMLFTLAFVHSSFSSLMVLAQTVNC